MFEHRNGKARTRLSLSSNVVNAYIGSGQMFIQKTHDWCKREDDAWARFSAAGGAYQADMNRMNIYYSATGNVRRHLTHAASLYHCLGKICGKCRLRGGVLRCEDLVTGVDWENEIRRPLKHANFCSAALARIYLARTMTQLKANKDL
jgi:hypothetical protein